MRIASAIVIVLFLASVATGAEARRPSPDTVGPIAASLARRQPTPAQDKKPEPGNCRRHRILTGLVIGAAAGAGLGIVEANVNRDCGTCGTTYVRSAVVFGSFGAGIGVAIGALAGRSCR